MIWVKVFPAGDRVVVCLLPQCWVEAAKGGDRLWVPQPVEVAGQFPQGVPNVAAGENER